MKMSSPSSILILGASSMVVPYLLARLDARATPVIAVGRHKVRLPATVSFVAFDTLASSGWRLPADTVVISLLPLPVLAATLPRLGGARGLVALGSTSRYSKARSSSPAERRGAEALLDAERELERWSTRTAIPFTLLRPTLVYDLVHDRNIARMAVFIRRFRCLPVAHPATGLRQPVHADDVAKAMIAALRNPAAANRAFDIAGGEVLTYRAMAERVFRAVGQSPRLVMLPTPVLRRAFTVAQTLGLMREASFGSSVFERMNQDLVFPFAEGREVLAYDPRPFDLPPEPRPGDFDSRSVPAL